MHGSLLGASVEIWAFWGPPLFARALAGSTAARNLGATGRGTPRPVLATSGTRTGLWHQATVRYCKLMISDSLPPRRVKRSAGPDLFCAIGDPGRRCA